MVIITDQSITISSNTDFWYKTPIFTPKFCFLALFTQESLFWVPKKALRGPIFNQKKDHKGTLLVSDKDLSLRKGNFFLTKTQPPIFLGIASAFSPGRAFFYWYYDVDLGDECLKDAEAMPKKMCG